MVLTGKPILNPEKNNTRCRHTRYTRNKLKFSKRQITCWQRRSRKTLSTSHNKKLTRLVKNEVIKQHPRTRLINNKDRLSRDFKLRAAHKFWILDFKFYVKSFKELKNLKTFINWEIDQLFKKSNMSLKQIWQKKINRFKEKNFQ